MQGETRHLLISTQTEDKSTQTDDRITEYTKEKTSAQTQATQKEKSQ